ncbi:hypothetical protein Bca52824_015468 [Brassica carinata]|uniref:Uncharacterized protein n=1 Tax=Brassica carinata TaxID=52824 RepID=A0A8X8B4D5_BRACI|nr:hypothetical protein Bca52824_015468 [Brassica carinata]
MSITPATPPISPTTPDPPDFNQLSAYTAAAENIKPSSSLTLKTRKSKCAIPLEFSCDEIYERMESGFCIFCEERDTPGHHDLKHKGVEIIMIESDDQPIVTESRYKTLVESDELVIETVMKPDSFSKSLENLTSDLQIVGAKDPKEAQNKSIEHMVGKQPQEADRVWKPGGLLAKPTSWNYLDKYLSSTGQIKPTRNLLTNVLEMIIQSVETKPCMVNEKKSFRVLSDFNLETWIRLAIYERGELAATCALAIVTTPSDINFDVLVAQVEEKLGVLAIYAVTEILKFIKHGQYGDKEQLDVVCLDLNGAVPKWFEKLRWEVTFGYSRRFPCLVKSYKAVTKALVQWKEHPPDQNTWNMASPLKIIQFSILEDKYDLRRKYCDKISPTSVLRYPLYLFLIFLLILGFIFYFPFLLIVKPPLVYYIYVVLRYALYNQSINYFLKLLLSSQAIKVHTRALYSNLVFRVYPFFESTVGFLRSIYPLEIFDFAFWRKTSVMHFGGKLRLCILAENFGFAFWRKTSVMHFGGKLRLCILAENFDFAFWRKTSILRFGGKLRFCILAENFDFRVLAENFGYAFWRKTSILRFGGKLRFCNFKRKNSILQF